MTLQDTAVFDLIKEEEQRQLNGIELIASENFTSPAVMEATGSVLTNKYAEGYPGKRYYGGCEVVDEVERLAKEVKPKMIIAGASAYSRYINFSKFREIADTVGSFLLADISHPSGMIATGLLSDPMPHCHVVTTTTHKTLRGPRGGLILMGQDFDNPFGLTLKNGTPQKMSHLLNMAVFPGNQGGPLMHVIAAKAIAFQEALQPSFGKYMRQVRNNAQAM